MSKIATQDELNKLLDSSVDLDWGWLTILLIQ